MMEYFYRFEDRSYSVADEYGEHSYSTYDTVLLVYPVVKHTACGTWIGLNSCNWPEMPSGWIEGQNVMGKKWVSHETVKRYALPRIEEAAISYRARKNRQISIFEHRAKKAREHLETMERRLANMQGGMTPALALR